MSEDDKKLVAKAIEIVQQALDVTTGRWISTADMLPAEGEMCVISYEWCGMEQLDLAEYDEGGDFFIITDEEKYTLCAGQVDWWYAVPERSEG